MTILCCRSTTRSGVWYLWSRWRWFIMFLREHTRCMSAVDKWHFNHLLLNNLIENSMCLVKIVVVLDNCTRWMIGLVRRRWWSWKSRKSPETISPREKRMLPIITCMIEDWLYYLTIYVLVEDTFPKMYLRHSSAVYRAMKMKVRCYDVRTWYYYIVVHYWVLTSLCSSNEGVGGGRFGGGSKRCGPGQGGKQRLAWKMWTISFVQTTWKQLRHSIILLLLLLVLYI